jgi:hypothetical protein
MSRRGAHALVKVPNVIENIAEAGDGLCKALQDNIIRPAWSIPKTQDLRSSVHIIRPSVLASSEAGEFTRVAAHPLNM